MQLIVEFNTAGPPPPDLRALADEARRRVKQAVQTLVCPTHGRGAVVTVVGTADGRIDLRVGGCCHAFARTVKWRVEGLI